MKTGLVRRLEQLEARAGEEEASRDEENKRLLFMALWGLVQGGWEEYGHLPEGEMLFIVAWALLQTFLMEPADFPEELRIPDEVRQGLQEPDVLSELWSELEGLGVMDLARTLVEKVRANAWGLGGTSRKRPQ
jgi:hypothetical protein